MGGGVPKENKSVFTPVFHLLTLNQRQRVHDCAPSHNASRPDPQLPEGNDQSRKEAIFTKNRTNVPTSLFSLTGQRSQ